MSPPIIFKVCTYVHTFFYVNLIWVFCYQNTFYLCYLQEQKHTKSLKQS